MEERNRTDMDGREAKRTNGRELLHGKWEEMTRRQEHVGGWGKERQRVGRERGIDTGA